MSQRQFVGSNQFLLASKSRVREFRSRSALWSASFLPIQASVMNRFVLQDTKTKMNFRRGAKFVSKNYIRNAWEKMREQQQQQETVDFSRKSCHCSQCGALSQKQFHALHQKKSVGMHTVLKKVPVAGELAIDSFNQLYHTVAKKDSKKLQTEPAEPVGGELMEESLRGTIGRQSLCAKQQLLGKQMRVSTLSEFSNKVKGKKISSIDFQKFQRRKNVVNNNVSNSKSFKFGYQYNLNGYFKYQKSRTKTIQTLQSELNVIRSKNKSQLQATRMRETSREGVQSSPYFPDLQTLRAMEQKRREHQLMSSSSSRAGREQQGDSVSSSMANKMRKLFQ